MPKKLILISALFAFFTFTHADTKETIRLAKITEDYAKCVDVALGNFSSDKEAQYTIKVLYKAMISNIEKMVDLERESKNESTIFFLDIMGEEVFTGYLLRSFTELDAQYKTQKQKLSEQFDHDWRKVNQQLWSTQGCNAIYVNLSQ